MSCAPGGGGARLNIAFLTTPANHSFVDSAGRARDRGRALPGRRPCWWTVHERPGAVLTGLVRRLSRDTVRTCVSRKRTGSRSEVRLGVFAMMALGLRWEPRGSVLGCRAGSIRDHAATRMVMKAPVGAVASVGAAMSKVSG